MVSPYLKNKGSAVRFCLWPQILLDLKSLSKKYSITHSGVIHIVAHSGEEIALYEDLFKKYKNTLGSKYEFN